MAMAMAMAFFFFFFFFVSILLYLPPGRQEKKKNITNDMSTAYQSTAGISLLGAKQRIGARTGTPEECTLLGEKRGSPVLTMERAAHDDSGRPVEWGRHCYRASQYSFEVTLVDH